jgi:hypothetical protein
MIMHLVKSCKFCYSNIFVKCKITVDVDVSGNVILKWILGRVAWTGFFLPRIGTGGVVKTVVNFHEMYENSSVAEQLGASQERLSSNEVVK